MEKFGKDNKIFYVRPPSVDSIIGTEYLSVAKKDVPGLVTEYLDAMDKGTTKEWCQCTWEIHPDDVDIPEDHCRTCGEHLDSDFHATSNPDFNCVYFGRRMRRKDDEPYCPVHSKMGLVLGFFEYVFKEDGELGSIPKSEKLSPNDWLLQPQFAGMHILDNDGWTYSEWTKQEKITEEEFKQRFNKCTISHD